MEQLFSAFQSTSKSEWLALLEKELKGDSLDKLLKVNQVEEISYPSYFHREDYLTRFSDPGEFPFTRGNNADSNDWEIGTVFQTEQPELQNKAILHSLMNGTTALVLQASNENTIDFEALLAGVELAYIQTTFQAVTLEQVIAFRKFIGNNDAKIIFHDNQLLAQHFDQLKGDHICLFGINGFNVHQAGGTTWQENAISLAEAHDVLHALMEKGVTVADACASIHFVCGIGSKFFFEVAKFRALRTTWSLLVNTYDSTLEVKTHISAQTSTLFTSLKDPYTNLLRQTTQAMSAVIGGVQQLTVVPYDWYASQPSLSFSRRMATNISLLLKEESYFQFVVDPAGGAYAMDALTDTIIERTWSTFQEIERMGGLTQTATRDFYSERISEKAALRKEQLSNKTEQLIGINVFLNPESITNDWQEVPLAWNGLPSLILEKA
jgi:methylmalonyl-CoA mutase